jgi:D-glycero-D-manno-heptose 1,7-bisphosphate phosphatase
MTEPACAGSPGAKALFLDRDGVICRALPPKQYVLSPAQIWILPEIHAVIRRARDCGYLVIVVTNQPQVAYGMLAPRELESIHAHMRQHLHCPLDAIYVCPHRDEDGCGCRKPKPGLLLQAIRDFRIDPLRSVMIGDNAVDILAAHRAGCATALLLSDADAPALPPPSPAHTVIPHLTDAIEFFA